jgi:molybdate transport system ATP-binding protein
MSENANKVLSVATRVEYPGFSLDVSIDEKLDGIVGLFGPSGSGKSTLLRVIAGLEQPASGRVSFGGESWHDSTTNVFVSPSQRPVGFVFQHARLFPHLTVDGNLNYAHRRGAKSSNIDYKNEVVAALSLDTLLARTIDRLSGGEMQRVALGRTLLGGPRLLLLDEPMAALDNRSKNEILPYLESLPERFGVPAIFVSHSVNEMARLADRVIVLDKGRVEAVGSASGILSRESLHANSIPFEPVTILDVTVTGHLSDLHLTQAAYGDQQLAVPELHTATAGDIARLSVRAGDVVLATSKPENLSVRNILAGKVTAITDVPESAFVLVSVDIGGAVLKARITHQAVGELGLTSGTPVYALIKTATFDRGV